MPGAQRTILIGVDYSDHCIAAVDEAVRLVVGDPAARLIPLLALPGAPMTHPSGARALTDDLVARSRENLTRLISARARSLGVLPPQAEPRVTFGAPAKCLLEEARSQQADLIVVGTHGRRGLSHLMLGSVAEAVVRSAPCSVLVARRSGVAAPGVALDDEGAEASTTALPIGAGIASPDTLEEDEVGDGADEGVNPDAVMVLSEPYLDAGHVLLHVLDVPTGQQFVCAFDDLETVRVEPLEGQWVPQPSSAARVRAARAALEEARLESELFGPLFEALSKQKSGGGR